MGTDSDHYSTETTGAFGPFLRRIDPMLRLEDENPVFEAFRLRKKAPSLPLSKIMISGLILISLATALVVGLISRFGILFFLIGFVVVVLSGSARGAGLRSARGARCPTRVEQLTRKNGCHKETMRDLWMCGITGSQIAEAIVLQDAIALRLRMSASLFIGTVVAVAAAGMIFHGTQFWWILLPVLALIYMVGETVRHQWVTALRSAFKDLRERLDFMRGFALRESAGVRAVRSAGTALKEIVGLSLRVLFFLIGLALMVFVSFGNVEAETIRIVGILVCLSTTAAFTLVGFWLRLRRRRFWIRNYREFRKICLEYDFVFDQFVRVVILEDNDA
jgi:hypothetical protein